MRLDDEDYFVKTLIATAAGKPRPIRIVKAAVPAIGVGSGLAPTTGVGFAFFDAVRERSLLGRLEDIRRIPFDVRVVTTQDNAVASWVAEGQAKPLTSTALTQTALPPRKILAVAVVTQELLKSTDPAAERAIRADLLRALIHAIDQAFLDPLNAGDAGTPASVTNGAGQVNATVNPDNDLRALIAMFEGDLSVARWVMSPLVAVTLHSADKSDIGAGGGKLFGAPVLVTRSSPAGQIALIDPSGIALAEGEPESRVITRASVLMTDDPVMASLPTPIATQLISLWQVNSVALVAGQQINWVRARAGSVAFISGANYS